MRSVLAIAGIAVRNAIRSRVVACLLAILALIIFGLPLVVKGDGTPEGQVHIMLNYTLGLAALVLSLTTLWAGCAAISSEIAEKQIHLVVTKPVYRYQIWLGKWLGLMVVNGVLLAACGFASYGFLQWTLGHRELSQDDQARLHRDILTARRTVQPAAVDLDTPARAMLDEYVKHNEIPTNVPPEKILQAFRQDLLMQSLTVKPGAGRRWDFDVPAEGKPRACTLQFRIASSRMGIQPVAGTWKAGPPDRPGAFEQTTTNLPGATQAVTLPSDFAERGGHVIVEYANADADGASVVFMPADAPVMLITTDGFEGNFVRALLVVLANLAFLTAVGVTAGSLFSMPVAGFLSLFLVVLMQLSAFIANIAEQDIIVPWHTERGQGPNFTDAAFRLLFKGIHALIAPLQDSDPLGALASGRLVSWLLVGDVALVQVVLYGGMLVLLGALAFGRREVGMPE